MIKLLVLQGSEALFHLFDSLHLLTSAVSSINYREDHEREGLQVGRVLEDKS